MYCVEVKGNFSAAHVLEGETFHGHNFRVTVKVYGELNENHMANHMVIDFRDIKKILDSVCSELDHKIIVPSKASSVKILDKEVELRSNEKFYSFPKEDTSIIPIESATAELIAKYIHTKLKEKITNKISVKINESSGCSAEYSEI